MSSASSAALSSAIPSVSACCRARQLLVALPAAILVAGSLALCIGALSLRTSGVQFIMITLAFAQMLFFLFVSLKAYGGDDGLIMRRAQCPARPATSADDTIFYYICLVGAALVFGASSGASSARPSAWSCRHPAERAPHGRDRLAALSLQARRLRHLRHGRRARRGADGQLLRFVSPDMLHWTKSGELMIMVILGGVGTLFGPLFGAAALVILETVLDRLDRALAAHPRARSCCSSSCSRSGGLGALFDRHRASGRR